MHYLPRCRAERVPHHPAPSKGTPLSLTRPARACIVALASLGLAAVPAFAGTISPPEQISDFTLESGENGLQQSVAMIPNGTGMGITYAKYNDGTDDIEAFAVQPVDAQGKPTGTSTRIIDETADAVDIGYYVQPAIAYNPVSGGWLACAPVDATPKEVMCAYLDPDGTRNGSLFPVSKEDGTLNAYSHVSIAWSTAKQKFLVAYAADANPAGETDRGLRWVGATGGSEGSLLPLPYPPGADPSISGSLGNLIYAPERDDFAVSMRARGDVDESYQPWLYTFDGDGVVQGNAVPFDGTLATQYLSGTVAYVAATDNYVISSAPRAGGDILMRTTSATTPAALVSAASVAVGADFRAKRFRVITAAHPTRDQVIVTTALNRTTSAGGGRGVYVMEGTSTSLGALQLVEVTNTADDAADTVPGNRPRVVFNSDGCGYMLSYNKETTETVSTQWMTARYTASDCADAATLTVATAGDGAGTVTSDVGGVSCGATCTASVESGTVVTLTATPAAGSTFTGWSGGGCTGTGTCAVTVSAATTVTATFGRSSSGQSSNATPGLVASLTTLVTPPVTRARNGKFRTTLSLRYGQSGRYSFYFENASGTRIPLLRRSQVGRRTLTKTFYAPVVQNGTAGSTVGISGLTNVKPPRGNVLRVILQTANGSLAGQSIPLG